MAGPSCAGDPGGDETVSPLIDWSYKTRQNKQKLKYDANQCLITDYMSFVTQIEHVLQHAPCTQNSK